MVTRALGSASNLPIRESMRQLSGCAHRLQRLAHSWARALVSCVKKAGHWAWFGEANKSQVNGPNRIENLSKVSRWSAYSSSSKDNLGKASVSRGLGATGRRCGMDSEFLYHGFNISRKINIHEIIRSWRWQLKEMHHCYHIRCICTRDHFIISKSRTRLRVISFQTSGI